MSVQTEKGGQILRKEFAFPSSSIILQVSRGILVGIIIGCNCWFFSFLIEKGFHIVQHFYQQGHGNHHLVCFHSAVLCLCHLD